MSINNKRGVRVAKHKKNKKPKRVSKLSIDFSYPIDNLYDTVAEFDEEYADELGNFDYFAKAEAEDNSCPLH